MDTYMSPALGTGQSRKGSRDCGLLRHRDFHEVPEAPGLASIVLWSHISLDSLFPSPPEPPFITSERLNWGTVLPPLGQWMQPGSLGPVRKQQQTHGSSVPVTG